MKYCKMECDREKLLCCKNCSKKNSCNNDSKCDLTKICNLDKMFNVILTENSDIDNGEVYDKNTRKIIIDIQEEE